MTDTIEYVKKVTVEYLSQTVFNNYCELINKNMLEIVEIVYLYIED